MDFSYPETHEEVKKLSAQILGDFAEPDRLKRLEAEGPYFDRELWASIVDSGLHTATLPESLGGMGLDFMACTVIAEQLGHTVASIPYISTVAACIQPLLNYANHSTVKTALAGFIDGSSLVTAAWLEPFNENPLTPDISARRDGDKLHLTGNKHCVPYAADSTYVLLSANVEGELCAALLATQQAGVQLTEQLCTANEPQFLLALNNAEANIICRGDDASRLIQQSLAMATSAYCSMAGGMNEKMARIGGEYTSQREQFGVAIATFQAVAHKLANCYIDAECMKIIALKAASDVSSGDYDNDTLHMAKAWAGDTLHRVSHAVQHVHGGTGIDKDYHLFRYCLWAKQIEMSLGNSKEHISVLADRLESRYLAKISA